MQDATLLVFNTTLVTDFTTATFNAEPESGTFGDSGGGFVSATQGAAILLDVSNAAAIRGPSEISLDIISQIVGRANVCRAHGVLCGETAWLPSAWATFLSVSASVLVNGARRTPGANVQEEGMQALLQQGFSPANCNV